MASCFLFEDEGKLQEVIHLLKYKGITGLGVRLGRELGRLIQSDPMFMNANYLIPVPLHKIKHRERGYNQSEYICRGISAITRIPLLTSLMIRKKNTKSQTKLTLQERNENVRDAFTIDKRRRHLIGKGTFILVDDVITTGSTLNACARELMRHGAEKVLAASVALTK